MIFQVLGMAVLAAAAATFISVGALWTMMAIFRQGRGAERVPRASGAVVFVFERSAVVDLNPAAQLMVSINSKRVEEFDDLAELLSQRFPMLMSEMAKLGPVDQRNCFSSDRTEIATLVRRRDRLSLTINEVEEQSDRIAVDRPTLIAFEKELDSLRGTTEHMPFLVWRQDRAGNITWVNRAYLKACERFGDQSRSGVWPPARLFDIDLDQITLNSGKKPQRHRLGGDDGQKPHWYQFHVTELANDCLVSGMNVDTVVEAEDSLRTFVQTLSKTFADLPIGLAVFTRDRRLALFNPALADLTTIAPEQLIQRPTIFGFFDMLRDTQMMPEPKNYNTWRDQIVDLEASAANGTYLETWHLPFGRTFRVTGRPQIDGAVALLFEDISDEIGINRRYRTELEIGQSVLDSLDTAVAVFAPNGALTLTNVAYDCLWQTDTQQGMDTPFIADATATWTAKCVNTPIWPQVMSFAMTDTRREPFQADVMMRDGRPLRITLKPVANGSTLVSFDILTEREQALRRNKSISERGRTAVEG